MKAVILAGGEGTRLRPLTCRMPKPMVPIVNRPFLEHVLSYLKAHGVHEVMLALCYLPEKIQGYFQGGSRHGLKLSYVVEDTPLGTAGAVKNVQSFLDDTFLVLNGDIFTDADLGALLAFHREKGASATIALTPVEDPTPYGLVETDSRGRVLRFVEKPSPEAVSSPWINAGIYVLEPEVLDLVPADTFFMFERGLFPLLLQRLAPLYAYRTRNCYWMDMGTPQKYLKLHRDILLGSTGDALSQTKGGGFPGEMLYDGVWAGPGCRVHPGATVKGPVLMGEGCVIGDGARVSGPSVLGPRCVVSEEAVVQEAVLWEGAKVGPRCTLNRCVIGSGATLEEGVWVTDGSIVGDGVVVGKGNRLERGLALWPGTRLEPGAISFLR